MATNEEQPRLGPFAAAMSAAVRSVVAGKRISGSDLARRLNRAQSYVSVRLNGHKSWTLDEVDQIAKILDIEVDQIYDLAQSMYR